MVNKSVVVRCPGSGFLGSGSLGSGRVRSAKGWSCVLWGLLVFCGWSGTVTAQEAARPELTGVLTSRLEHQVAAWNRGDIKEFMSVYWMSPQLTFSSAGKTTRGWQSTLDGYIARYPDKQAMGKLSFAGLEVYPLGDETALVLGRWKLDRDNDSPHGVFSLVFRKLDHQWVIVHDHTSLWNDPDEE